MTERDYKLEIRAARAAQPVGPHTEECCCARCHADRLVKWYGIDCAVKVTGNKALDEPFLIKQEGQSDTFWEDAYSYLLLRGERV
jgi:hypothetical protein